jgi:hypothetical protein
MSQDQAHAFIEFAGRTPAVQAELDQLRGPGVFPRLIEIGARYGYVFTEEAYREAVVAMAEGELSDAALDEVLRETGLK